MNITMLKSKIHRAAVTQARTDYVGSITVDRRLLDAAGILEYEKVQVVDVDNGSRMETYTIAGDEGVICLNGAAARLVDIGDKIIIMAYCSMTPEEAKAHRPRVVFVDDKNCPVRIANYEKSGALYDTEKNI
ncbi:MAG: aspartate 1-decarboxylase [Clostridiales bacterium]|nr:aspartate 1-decarboxylase [Clostridiales bacterium]